jgi:membrane-associated phospholipid phosphatase
MDIEYLLFLQDTREALGGLWTSVFLFITNLGSVQVLMPIAGCLFWCGYKRMANQLLLSMGIASALNAFIKLGACVSRPWLRDPRVVPVPSALATATGYSFPSGHTATATAFFGTIALRLRKHRVVVVLALALIVLIGFSRNFVGVHTPQDVVVSLVITAVVVLTTGRLLDWAEKDGHDRYLLIGALVIGVALVIFSAFKPYPATFADGSPTDVGAMARDSFAVAGLLVGFALGWYLERRYSLVTVPQNRLWLIFRCFVGVALLYLVVIGLGALLTSVDTGVSAFASSLGALLFLLVVYPLICKTISNSLHRRPR